MKVSTYKFSHLLSLLLLGVFVFGYSSCTYDAVLEPEDPPITGDVSFAQDILPIFNQSCNNSGCHNTGGTPPDLTPGKAYDALKAGNYIDLNAPENSELYLWMRGQRALPMPLSGPNSLYNATVLAWIKQGALNN